MKKTVLSIRCIHAGTDPEQNSVRSFGRILFFHDIVKSESLFNHFRDMKFAEQKSYRDPKFMEKGNAVRGKGNTPFFKKGVPLSPSPRLPFTLIELLVVIAIIAVLAGMLLPALGRTKVIAQTITCSSHVKQLQLTNINYANDFRSFVPNSIANVPSRFQSTYRWYEIMGEYLGWTSRSIENASLYRMSLSEKEASSTIFSCSLLLNFTSDYYFYQAVSSYGLNSSENSQPAAKVKKPSLKISFYDTGCYGFYTPGAGAYYAAWVGRTPGHPYIQNSVDDFFKGRHDRKNVAGFYDGHAQSMPSLELAIERDTLDGFNCPMPPRKGMFKLTE